MKTNLATMPQTEDFDDCIKYADAVKKWKFAFEKELRSKLTYPTNTKSVAVYDFIKEVLGDS